MPLLEVRNLRIYYYTPTGVVRAVDGVDLYLEKGESLCVVGESGSGKSTLGLGIVGLVDLPGKVVGGEVWFDNRLIVSSSAINTQGLLGRKITMIFQDPRSALNPFMKIGEQIVEAITYNLGVDRDSAYKMAYEALQAVEIPDPSRILDSYPHELSGGMAQRVVIAIAISTGPELIIADEPTSALDVTIQAQILKLLRSIIKEQSRSLIFITHDLSVAMEICDRTAVMYAGKIVEEGPTRELFEKPLHPYTSALLASIPKIATARALKLPSIPGEPPHMTRPPPGCRFHPRCRFRFDPCDKEEPQLRSIDARRKVACFLYSSGGGGDVHSEA